MDLLIQTVALRPYVFAFVVIYLVLALRDLGPGRTLLFSVWAFLVAWIAELASTRIGIPFGLSHYSLVLGFNLIISWWIRAPSLFLLGALLHVSLFLLWSCYALGGGQAGRGVFSSSSRTAFDSD
ncbi:MAG: carotenoid biosynthesis protein [Candidatus Rokubacteria bacterium]|nr:carotenoid biosynthesis protein [Candidatus Rokubacteria bacterium]